MLKVTAFRYLDTVSSDVHTGPKITSDLCLVVI